MSCGAEAHQLLHHRAPLNHALLCAFVGAFAVLFDEVHDDKNVCVMTRTAMRQPPGSYGAPRPVPVASAT